MTGAVLRLALHSRSASQVASLKCVGGSSRKGATKTKRAYRTAHAHHRGDIRPDSESLARNPKAKAQPGMAGAIPGRLGRVCLAYSTRYY